MECRLGSRIALEVVKGQLVKVSPLAPIDASGPSGKCFL